MGAGSHFFGEGVSQYPVPKWLILLIKCGEWLPLPAQFFGIFFHFFLFSFRAPLTLAFCPTSGRCELAGEGAFDRTAG